MSEHPDSTRDYSIHGAAIRVAGDGPVADIIDRTLGFFRSPGGQPELSLTLGRSPSVEWNPEGVLIGDRILYDEGSGTTTVFGDRPVGGPKRSDIEYVVVGDLRSPGGPVAVYVPNLRRPLPSRSSFVHNLRRRNLTGAALTASGDPLALRRVARQAEAITEAIIEPFLFYRLPTKGMSLVHAGAVDAGKGGMMFAGSASVGKTTLAIRYVANGAAFLGDAMVILTEDGRVHPYPGLLKLNAGHLKSFPDLETRLTKGLGPSGAALLRRELRGGASGVLESLPQPQMAELFDQVAISRGCPLSRVILIRRGSFEKATSEAAGGSVAPILTAEISWELEAAPWRNAQFIYAPSAATGKDFVLEASEHHSKVRDIIGRGVSRAECHSVSLPYGASASLVEELVPALNPRGPDSQAPNRA